MKIRLTQQGDFNLQDAFQMLDAHKKGWVTAPDLHDTLLDFGIYCHKDDVYAFVRKFDHDSDGRLLFSDFCDAFTPNDSYYVHVLNNRQPHFCHAGVSRFNFFTTSTRDMLFRCFKTHFSAEESCNLAKKRLARRPRFNVRDIFRYLDNIESGVLSKECLKTALADNQHHVSESELTWLFDRFDRTKSGRVNYQQFAEGLMPNN